MLSVCLKGGFCDVYKCCSTVTNLKTFLKLQTLTFMKKFFKAVPLWQITVFGQQTESPARNQWHPLILLCWTAQSTTLFYGEINLVYLMVYLVVSTMLLFLFCLWIALFHRYFTVSILQFNVRFTCDILPHFFWQLVPY